MTAGSKGTALITGAAGGMGTAIAKALAAEGHRLVLVDRNADRLAALLGTLSGGAATSVALDITDGKAVAGLLDRVPKAFRPIDILINNAGHDVGGRQRFDVGSPDDWAAIVETNLIGTMRITRAVLPDMVARNTGDVITMGSIAALRIVADMAPYNASKAGLHMLIDVLRAELAETGIRVTEIMPGLTRTGIILSRYRGDRRLEQEYFDQFKLALEPEDVARTIVFAVQQPRHVQIAQLVVLPVNRW